MTEPNHAEKPRHWMLVVDDDEPIRVLLTSALSSDDLEVVTAADAATALKLLAEKTSEPLLVFTDVLMPGMDGLTLTRKLSSRLKQSKLVVMSGHLHDAAFWPTDLRGVTFLSKPLRMAELAALVDVARSER